MYNPKFSKSVIKQFSKLPVKNYTQVFLGIISLLANPQSSALDTEKLTDFAGYRLRVGDYRVLYTIDYKTKEISISAIKHRKDAY